MTNRHNCLLLFLATLLIAFLPSQGQASSTPLGSDFLEVVLPFSGPSSDILDASAVINTTAQVPEVGLQNALELIASRIQNVVRVDFVKERWIAEELRRREVPFVLTNIPEVVEATNRWNSDYLELLASAASSTCNTAVKHVPKEWLLQEFPNLASENRSTFFAVDAEHYSPYPAAQEVQLRIHVKQMPVEIHFDRARTFISIIKGSTRNYFLFPPSQCSNLYVQPDCYRPLYRRSLIPDILDVPRVMQEHPQFESAQAIYVELNPGETLYIPSFWFHRIDGMDNYLILKRAGYAKERHEEIASEQCLDSETFREAYHTFPFISFNECLLQEEAPSDTPTPSESASISPSATLSASFSATISETASATVSATVSATASVSPLVLCGNGVVDLNEECDFNDRSKPSRDRKCCRSDCTFESKDVTCIKETRCFTSAQCNKGTCGGLKLKESCKAKITETPSLPHLKPTKSDSSKSQSAIVATLVLLLCLAVATLV